MLLNKYQILLQYGIYDRIYYWCKKQKKILKNDSQKNTEKMYQK